MIRLHEHLRALGLSNSQAKDALSSGKVHLCGVPTGDGGRLVDPATVSLRPNAPRLHPGADLVLLYRDDALGVIWKPPGMLSVPAPRAGGHKNAVGLAGRILGEAHIVHRLDEHTSGLLLVARTVAAQTALKALLEVHAVDRRYLAIVAGSAPEGERRVSSVLRRDRGDGLRGSDPEGEEGKPAVTYFQLRERLGPRYSLVEARLETGRTHQVRIHLAEQGLPLLGDPLYAPAGVARLWPRQALHAWSLAFRHPFTRQELRFEAPLADDLEQLRRRILASA